MQYNETFSETTEVGSQIIRVIATDADSGSFGDVTYSILSGNEVKDDMTFSMLHILSARIIVYLPDSMKEADLNSC